MATYVVSNNVIGADNFYNLASGDIYLQTATGTFVSWMTVLETGIYATGKGVTVSIHGLINVGHIDLLGGDQVVLGPTSTVLLTAAYGFHIVGDLGSAPTTLVNQGSVYSANTPLSTALYLQLESPVSTGEGTAARLYNSGLISSQGVGVYIAEASNGASVSAILENRGQIQGMQAVTFSGASDQILNHGQMTGTVDAVIYGRTSQAYDFSPYILNTGALTLASAAGGFVGTAAISLERGLSTTSSVLIENSGRIDGKGRAIYLDLDSGQISNTGVILGNILSVSGGVQITNSSGTIRGSITTGSGIDSLTNGGTLVGGVNLGAGSDVLDLRGGRLLGLLEVSGGQDGDSYYVDNSSIRITELGTDTGIDTVFAAVSFRLRDGFENLTLMDGADFNGAGNNLGNTILGNSGENRLWGGTGNDSIVAGTGDDTMFGGAGNDTLMGNNGFDILVGGNGTDQMTGGGDADVFLFNRPLEMSNADPDYITDFVQGDDLIDLSAIDANRVNSLSNDAFLFIGTAAFSNVAGQLRYEFLSGGTYIRMDLNGDGTSDYSIRTAGNVSLIASDFAL